MVLEFQSSHILSLQKLSDFEENYAHVVYKLRELAAKSRAITAITSNENEPLAEEEEIVVSTVTETTHNY